MRGPLLGVYTCLAGPRPLRIPDAHPPAPTPLLHIPTRPQHHVVHSPLLPLLRRRLLQSRHVAFLLHHSSCSAPRGKRNAFHGLLLEIGHCPTSTRQVPRTACLVYAATYIRRHGWIPLYPNFNLHLGHRHKGAGWLRDTQGRWGAGSDGLCHALHVSPMAVRHMGRVLAYTPRRAV